MGNALIVCVDDEKIILTGLESELDGNFGRRYDIELAESGEEALEIVQEAIEDGIEVAMVISDFIMPSMKGDELLIKIHELSPDTIKIMLTGQADTDGIANTINKAKLYRYIAKPWERSDLILTLEEALKSYEKEKKLKEHHKILEQTVKEKTEELRILNSQLEERVKEEVSKNIQQEKVLIQQARTSAMGEMMGAIIHQWKQPLSVINAVNNDIILKMRMDILANNNIEDATRAISSQIKHMTNTMDDFRNFFKPTKKQNFKLKVCIDNVVTMIGDLLRGKGIVLNIDIVDDVCSSGYPNELTQVFINILNNARDVIEERKPQNLNIDIKVYKDGDNATISITDYAGGIPEDIIDVVFDPYITTKPEDKGTGIGLDMSKTIINKAEGDIKAINIEKDGYKGASFIINLPLIKEEDCK
jgi:C4-dicarboxylate-specific signal transduction histidine kinase